MADAYDFWAAHVPRDQVSAIDDFWLRFREIAWRIERHFRGQAPGIDADTEIRAAMGPLRERLVADFEFGPEGELVLVLTPELYHSRRPLARAAVARAPRLPGWSFRDTRRPVARIPEAVRAILARSRSEALAVEALRPRRGAHRLVDLVAHGHGDREFVADQAGIIFSVLLGERADQDWLGDTHGRPTARESLRKWLARRPEPRHDRWLSEFREQAIGIIEGCEADRPARPFVETPMNVDETVTFRLRPTPGEPGRRGDAMLWQSRYRAFTAARLAGVRIAGLRFSRFDEVFCGLRIKRTGASPFAEVADIASFAARIEERLMRAKAGGITGRASGVDNVYVDLALVDLDGAIAALRVGLVEEGVTGPAWLLFDEAGLEDRYHPMTARTPPTPMA